MTLVIACNIDDDRVRGHIGKLGIAGTFIDMPGIRIAATDDACVNVGPG